MPRSLIKVTLDTKDGETTHEVAYDGRDIRAYEAEFDESMLTRTDYSQVCKLAFCAMRRQSLFQGSWEMFDGQCIEVEEIFPDDGEVDPERPTPPGPGDGLSSS